MKTATVVTQAEPVAAPSETASAEVARPNGKEIPLAPATSPASDVRVKQTKTTVTKVSKDRKRDGVVTTIVFWEVRTGSALSKVYSTPAGDRELFTVSYWANGERKRAVLASWDEAIEAAKNANKDMGSGNATAPEISPVKRMACARALEIIAPYNVEIDVVASRYVELLKLTNGENPLRAVERDRQRNPPGLKAKMVKEVVAEMMTVKRSDDLSTRYVKQLDSDLTRFASRFRCRLGDVCGTDVDKWLRDLGVGPRTRNNLRNSVKSLFKFGVARKYLPKDHDEIDAVPVAKDADGDIEIYTPDEMAELMAVASPEHVPFLAISAFAGVRHAELQRLDWEHVKRKGRVIEIKAGTAKTASRRVIPIVPNLAKWLKPHWKAAGEICGYANMVLQFVELTRRVNEKRRAVWAKANHTSAKKLHEADKVAEERLAKLTRNQRRSRGTVMPGAETAQDEGWTPFLWKHNALRHSFISYRVAQTQNVAQVALEAGNSPGMIFKHYRELVQPKEAKAWFAIVPK
jgi:integrase